MRMHGCELIIYYLRMILLLIIPPQDALFHA